MNIISLEELLCPSGSTSPSDAFHMMIKTLVVPLMTLNFLLVAVLLKSAEE